MMVAHMMIAQRAAVQNCPAPVKIAQSMVAQKVVALLQGGQSLTGYLRVDQNMTAQRRIDRRIPLHLKPVQRMVAAHKENVQRKAG